MQTPSIMWTKWANILDRYHVTNLAAWLLEAGEPLNIVGAQILYFGQPLLGDDRLHDLAYFLEDKEKTRAFADYLRKD